MKYLIRRILVVALVPAIAGCVAVRTIARLERPAVLLMDSRHPARVYDSTTLAANRVNSDVLGDLLSDLPIRINKEAISPTWNRAEAMKVIDPALIVVHYSGFCDAQCVDRTPLRLLVEKFAATETKFIIYSRANEDTLRVKVDSLLREVEIAYPGTMKRVSPFGLLSHGTAHWGDTATANALKRRVKQVLGAIP